MTVLLDTGSDLSFISKAAFEKLRTDARVATAPPVKVRLTNGDTSISDKQLTTGLSVGSFRARSVLRVLDWDAYDVILGLDWLTQHQAQWDFHLSTLTLKNGSGKSSSISLRPFRTIDYGGIEEAGLNLISYRKAAKEYNRSKGSQATLVILRDSQLVPTKSKARKLPETTNLRVKALLLEFQEVFREELPPQKPIRRTVKHTIDTKDTPPINLPYYSLSKQHRDELEKQIRTLLEKGIIRPSSSPWGFPVLFVPKPNNEWRMCIDYRLLNNVTLKDAYPLPRIQDCLDTIGSAAVLSKVDLTAGYYQIEMDEMSIPKTAFNTRSGKYEFLAMPFGLTNAPSTFQRIMNNALQPFLGKFVIVYLDDIVIYSKNEKEHEAHLRQVLEALRQNELYAKPSKCTLAVDQLEFCGHVIGHGQCRPTASKVKAILDWPRPRNVHEVRQFLGLASYYRRYVRDFAKTAAPLSDLLAESDVELRRKKYRPIRWNVSCELALRTLKKALSSEPVLQQIDESKPFWIETDCSEWALGCMLCQEGPDGRWHPVAYDGRKLNGAELNYSIQEKELLAIKHALRIWVVYIQNGLQTIVVTDHESLKYLKTSRTPSKRLARWLDEFQEFDLDIRYRKGSEAIVPDAISRRPDFMGTGPANRAWVAPSTEDTVQLNATSLEPAEAEDLSWEATIVEALSTKDKSSLTPQQLDILRKVPDIDKFVTEDGRLLRKVDQYFVPYISTMLRKDFVDYYHRHYGHFSAPALNGVIKFRGWWPTMQKDVTTFAQQCRQCQLAQQPKVRNEEPYTQVRLGARPFEKWAIDFVGPLPLSSDDHKQWILTAIDFATGWPVAKAVREATDEVVADFLFEIYCQYGAFKELLSDNGANLNAAIVEYYLEKIKVKHRTTTPYHPQTNGKVERFNGMLGKILTKMLIGTPPAGWTNYLSAALFACRARAHTVTGMSPFKLVYGIEPRLSGDEKDFDTSNLDADFAARLENLLTARHDANKLLLERGIYAQRLRSTRLRPVDTGFEEGQWVVLRNSARQKFEATYFGPFKILKKLWFGTYILETNDGRVFRNPTHGSRLLNYNFEASPENQQILTASTQNRLRREGEQIINPSEEMLKVLDSREIPPTYTELSLMPKNEWVAQQRSGDRSGKVGEGFDAVKETLTKEKRRRQQKQKKLGKNNSFEGSLDVIPSKYQGMLPPVASNLATVPNASNTGPSNLRSIANASGHGGKSLPANGLQSFENMGRSEMVPQPFGVAMAAPEGSRRIDQGFRNPKAPEMAEDTLVVALPEGMAPVFQDKRVRGSGSRSPSASFRSLADQLIDSHGPSRDISHHGGTLQMAPSQSKGGLATQLDTLDRDVEASRVREHETSAGEDGSEPVQPHVPSPRIELSDPILDDLDAEMTDQNLSPFTNSEISQTTPAAGKEDRIIIDNDVDASQKDGSSENLHRRRKRKRHQRQGQSELASTSPRLRLVEGRSLRPNPKVKVIRD